MFCNTVALYLSAVSVFDICFGFFSGFFLFGLPVWLKKRSGNWYVVSSLNVEGFCCLFRLYEYFLHFGFHKGFLSDFEINPCGCDCSSVVCRSSCFLFWVACKRWSFCGFAEIDLWFTCFCVRVSGRVRAVYIYLCMFPFFFVREG